MDIVLRFVCLVLLAYCLFEVSLMVDRSGPWGRM